MQLADFDYVLPDALIAQYPPARRRDARLLVLGRAVGEWADDGVAALPALLTPGDLVVLNDTRVIPARLHGHKATGGAVEILIERLLSAREALAQIRARRAPRAGTRIVLAPRGVLEVSGREGDLFVLRATAGEELSAVLAASGHVPLPPYIARAAEALDAERYQTVYAARPGAVAAPTAGLHLDQELLDEIRVRGAGIASVTLHVGAGTFQPLRSDDLDAHVMHAERVEVTAAVCAAVARARAAGGRVIAIGTTVARALEAAARGPAGIAPLSGDTRLFIRAGFEFRVIDALLTNFHLPRSTLLLLVAAFGGYARVLAAYDHAIAAGYRFFSYGDAMWLERALT